ncbi:MAG: type II CAAX endopeptidase family protein [Nitrospirales bacterium]
MAFSALSPPDGQTDSSDATAPWWGAWSALVIVGCFYLTQAFGIFMVQIIAGFGLGLTEGIEELSNLEQTWLLPLSLFLSTVGGGMVSWQVAVKRAEPSMKMEWFWSLLGNTGNLLRAGRFLMLGIGLGLSFLALTEYGVLPPDDLPQPLFDAMMNAPLVLQIGWVLMFVVLFPVVEETLFRGFLFTGLTQSLGPILAGLLTTGLFVAVHMPKVVDTGRLY